REAVARGVAPLGKDSPFPARRALRSTASRPAEHGNITWKEYIDAQRVTGTDKRLPLGKQALRAVQGPGYP
ncbi:MAG: hypothetical protein OXS28_11025, partial [Gammaproteobacteria bacterium]|nr:hypothetical protein [Gammaproteobacteria bacterium]